MTTNDLIAMLIIIAWTHSILKLILDYKKSKNSIKVSIKDIKK